MFVKYTAIGREIQADDRIEEEKDAILFQLYHFHYNILNVKDVPMSLKRLSQAVRMSVKRVNDICDVLVEDGFIKKAIVRPDSFFKITGRGVHFVEKSYGGGASTTLPASAAHRSR